MNHSKLDTIHRPSRTGGALVISAALLLAACGESGDAAIVGDVDHELVSTSTNTRQTPAEAPVSTQVTVKPITEPAEVLTPPATGIVTKTSEVKADTEEATVLEENETNKSDEGIFTAEQLKNNFDIEALFNFQPGTEIGHTYSSRGLIDAPLILSESAYESGLFSGLADESEIPEDQHPELKFAGEGVVISLDTRIPGAYGNDDSTKFAHKTSGNAPLGNIDRMQIGDRVLDVYQAPAPNDYGVDRLALESKVIDIFTIPYDAASDDPVVERYGADNAFDLLYSTKKVEGDNAVTQTYYSCGTDSKGLGSDYRWGVVVQLEAGYTDQGMINVLIEEMAVQKS